MRKPNPMARDLRQPKYKPKTIPDKKKQKPYRKTKHKKGPFGGLSHSGGSGVLLRNSFKKFKNCTPNQCPICCGVGKTHPNRSKSKTQTGMLVFLILISSTDCASTSLSTSVVTISLPASCLFCCATTCCVFSFPAKTFAFTVGPPLLAIGFKKEGIVLHPPKQSNAITKSALLFNRCITFLTHPNTEATCKRTHAHANQPTLSNCRVR